jgi:hypothetical protein
MYDGGDNAHDLHLYSSLAGTVTADTAQKVTGTRSIKAAGDSVSTHEIVFDSTQDDAGRRCSFDFRTSSVAWSGTNPFFLTILTSGGTLVGSVGFKTGTAQLYVTPVGATQAGGSTNLLADTWYRITVSYVNTSTSSFEWKLYINGTLEATANAGTMTRVGASQLRMGIRAAAGSHNVWFDNIYCDDSSDKGDPGRVYVTAKRPFSNGSNNQLTTQIGSGNSGYGSGHADEVNEQPVSTTNGWRGAASGAALTEEYSVEAASAGDVDLSSGATIKGVQGWIYTFSSAAGNTAQIKVANTTTNFTTDNGANKYVRGVATTSTYPAGNTDIGFVTSGVAADYYLYDAGLMIAYTSSGTASFVPGIVNAPVRGVGSR